MDSLLRRFTGENDSSSENQHSPNYISSPNTHDTNNNSNDNIDYTSPHHQQQQSSSNTRETTTTSLSPNSRSETATVTANNNSSENNNNNISTQQQLLTRLHESEMKAESAELKVAEIQRHASISKAEHESFRGQVEAMKKQHNAARKADQTAIEALLASNSKKLMVGAALSSSTNSSSSASSNTNTNPADKNILLTKQVEELQQELDTVCTSNAHLESLKKQWLSESGSSSNHNNNFSNTSNRNTAAASSNNDDSSSLLQVLQQQVENLKNENEQLQKQRDEDFSQRSKIVVKHEEGMKKLLSRSSDARYVSDLEAELDAYREQAATLIAAARQNNTNTNNGSGKKRRDDDDDFNDFDTTDEDEDDEDEVLVNEEQAKQDEKLLSRQKSHSPTNTTATTTNSKKREDTNDFNNNNSEETKQNRSNDSNETEEEQRRVNKSENIIAKDNNNVIKIDIDNYDDDDELNAEISVLRATAKDQEEAMEALLEDARVSEQESLSAKVALSQAESQQQVALEEVKTLKSELSKLNEQNSTLGQELDFTQRRCEKFQREASDKSEQLRKERSVNQQQQLMNSVNNNKTSSISIPSTSTSTAKENETDNNNNNNDSIISMISNNSSNMSLAEWVQFLWFKRKMSRTTVSIAFIAILAIVLMIVSASVHNDVLATDDELFHKHCESYMKNKQKSQKKVVDNAVGGDIKGK